MRTPATPPLQVLFDFEKSDPDSFTTIIMATIRNSAKDDLTNFSCKVSGRRARGDESGQARAQARMRAQT